jgi:hypothetical protein
MPRFLLFLALYGLTGFGLALYETRGPEILGAFLWSVLEAGHMVGMIALAGLLVAMSRGRQARP